MFSESASEQIRGYLFLQVFRNQVGLGLNKKKKRRKELETVLCANTASNSLRSEWVETTRTARALKVKNERAFLGIRVAHRPKSAITFVTV